MQKPNGSKRGNVNGNSPTISEEGDEEEESAISIKCDPTLEDRELGQGEQHGTVKSRGDEKQKRFYGSRNG